MAFRYQGPTALASSRYALPTARKPTTQPAPSALAVQPIANNTIATQEQIAASGSAILSSNMAAYNEDAQLALAQNETLKEEVAKHSAALGSSVSSAVTNTRRLLDLLRGSIQKEGGSAASELKTVDSLWDELERLFDAATKAKSALPDFMAKQKENMNLYHNAMLNGTLRDSQDELNLQHKKVNIQHSLILDHQQSFKEYKENTEEKLKALKDCEEKVSRLSLDKGLLKTELEQYRKQVEEMGAGNAANVEAASALKQGIQQLEVTKKGLTAENETLRKTINDLQEKLKASEQKITDHYEAEIRKLSTALSKETTKLDGLNGLIKVLQNSDNATQQESRQMKEQCKKLDEKYKNQAAEFAKIFKELEEKNKKLNSLTSELEHTQRETSQLKQRASKLTEVEKMHAALQDAQRALEKQLQVTKKELADAKEDSARSNSEVESVLGKLKKLDKDNEDLELENNDLTAKIAEWKKSSQQWSAVKSDAAKMRAELEQLRNKPAATSTVDEGAVLELQGKLQESEGTVQQLAAELEGWKNLATQSYQEFKANELIITEGKYYKAQVEELTKKLQAAQKVSAQPNGSGGDDAKHWKQKYESLLAATY